jgi:hypothetical protein
MLECAMILILLYNCVSRLQGTRAGSDAWPVSYEIAGGSSAEKSPSSAVERRAPSAGELSLIRSLRDQLRCTQQELKRVTAQVDVALSKASRPANAEGSFLVKSTVLAKRLTVSTLLFVMYFFWPALVDRFFVKH